VNALSHAGGPGAVLSWHEGGAERSAEWLSPSSPPPSRLGMADDRTRAAVALARIRSGESLIYRADYHNARQLLAALGRRLRGSTGGRGAPGRGPSPTESSGFRPTRPLRGRPLSGSLPTRPAGADEPAALFRAERERILEEDVRAACEEALGIRERPGLLPLRDLLGMVGAHEWRRRGLLVPALGAVLRPHYGVYAPVRSEYVDLVAAAAREWPVAGKRAVDVGTGTGVLALVLARAGARVTAVDLEPRAVACAKDNVAALGLGERVEVVEADLFPDGVADLVVSNPPWIPAAAHTLLDRAVYDPGGSFLERLVLGLPGQLAPGGEVWLVLSDLAERLGLRPPGAVEALASRAGLAVAALREARPSHLRAREREDPLYPYRSAEVTRLYRMVRPG
jgi:methylase of polypeptide subunit release factors